MLAKAQDKIDTAKINMEHGKYDDVVSRSYYAVFFAISAVLFSKGLSFSTHSQVIGAFNREFIKTGIFPSSFTKMIKILFNERQTGDYDFDSWIDEPTARESLENAETIVSGIDRYLEIQP
ncbi:MAG: HEPN domain-containing protein [Candidatus Latescibacterota bacterium]